MKNKVPKISPVIFSCLLFVLVGINCVRPISTNLLREAYIGHAFSLRINDAINQACPEMEIDKAIELQELVEKHTKLNQVVHQYLCAYADWLQGNRDAVYEVDCGKTFQKMNQEILSETKKRNPQAELAISEQEFLSKLSQAEMEVESVLQNQVPYTLQRFGTPAIIVIKIYRIASSSLLQMAFFLIMAVFITPVFVDYSRSFCCSLGKVLLLQGCLWAVILPVCIKLANWRLDRVVDRIIGRSMSLDVTPLLWRGGILIGLGVLMMILGQMDRFSVHSKG